jgi:hypothetical protein
MCVSLIWCMRDMIFLFIRMKKSIMVKSLQNGWRQWTVMRRRKVRVDYLAIIAMWCEAYFRSLNHILRLKCHAVWTVVEECLYKTFVWHFVICVIFFPQKGLSCPQNMYNIKYCFHFKSEFCFNTKKNILLQTENKNLIHFWRYSFLSLSLSTSTPPSLHLPFVYLTLETF